eukprot:jgi/Botrbrau1/411/Bobra.110_2s0061.1
MRSSQILPILLINRVNRLGWQYRRIRRVWKHLIDFSELLKLLEEFSIIATTSYWS